MQTVLVIGGGPAGLRAAEISSESGAQVILCDQKRSVGRKFLVAGKSGLNLTHGQERDQFVTHYSGPRSFWENGLNKFDPQDVRKWAQELGVETFQASSGRVYPKSLKGAPLLRKWIARLKKQGVEFRMNHRLTALSSEEATFENGERIQADAIILALGGGSWPQTGSDGAWVDLLKRQGVKVQELASANSGWECPWPDEIIARLEGQPIKNVRVSANGQDTMGELMLTRYGLEGGPVYQLGAVLRTMENPEIILDFKPTFTKQRLIAKMESVRRNFLKESQFRWKLNEVTRLLLEQFYGPFESAEELAQATKNFCLPLSRARPLAEAISSAGGVSWESLSEDLMLKEIPGVFVAGEMMDWEAPTGGYLLQGCFVTGTLAAEAALSYLKAQAAD